MTDRDQAIGTDLPEEGSSKRLPSLDSYRGRYLALAAVLITTLLVIAWFGHTHVSQVAAKQVERLAERTRMQQTLRRGIQQLQRIEEWLHRQLIEPGMHQASSLGQEIDAFDATLSELQQLCRDERMSKLVAELRGEPMAALRRDSAEFLRISHDNRLRFPSTHIMQTRMLDKASDFTEIIDDIIRELRDQAGDGHDLALLLASHDLRDTWQKMVSEFRLLVANRFGVFADNPLSGMQARAVNIELHFDRLSNQLDTLGSMPIPEGSLFLESDSWEKLRRLAQGWHAEYQGLLEGLRGSEWRKDLLLYKNTLEPHIKRFQSGLYKVQNQISKTAARDIKGLTNVAEQLSRAIFVITLAGVLLVLGGYLYLRARILKPIADTTQALRQEALGISRKQIPLPKLRETRELVNAFCEMRREVSRRQQGLDYLAHHDPLTRLPNRILFRDRLQHAIELAQRNNQTVALLFLDLDNFKQINDTMGHLAGDELLINVARRLRNLLRSTDTVARLGGDEFAILLENIGGKRQARNTASKILATLSEPMELSGQKFHITTSIGIAMAPYDDRLPDNLIRDADTAMYEAKRQGKNAYFFFSAELLERATSQLNLEREIRAAIEKEEFLFHFQPIVHTRSKKIYGVEALIRWQPAGGKLRYPADFIETLLAIDTRQEYMERLLQQVDDLQQRCLEELQIQLPVAINLSASVLRNSTQHNLVLNALKRRRYTELMRIEITEDTLLEDLANAHVLLKEIQRLGVSLVLDDFGTGQSSLNHLRSFPFDAIKIDKEFVMNLESNQEDANLVKAVTQLAHSFNMKVVAEGMEKEAHRQYLADIGCDYAQGYLISRPISADRLFHMLEHIRSRKRGGSGSDRRLEAVNQ